MSSVPRPEYRKNELNVLLDGGSAVYERDARLRFQKRSGEGVAQLFLLKWGEYSPAAAHLNGWL